MSSPQGDKKDSDIEMGEATSPAPVLTSPAEAPACVAGHLSFREELVRRQAEKELAQAGSEFPSSSAQVVASCHGTEVMALLPQALPAGSSTTPILVEDKEKAGDAMPPPPARKDVVLALRAPSAVLATQPKSRKRKLAKSGDRENSQLGGSSLASGLRRKFISLIDGMIGECGSETSRLEKTEVARLQARTRQRVKRGLGRKVMSCRLISFFDCEMFRSRPVSRVLPQDVNSAGVLKMSNMNVEAWFKNLLSFDIMPSRFRDRFSAYTTCLIRIEHLSGDRKC
uniref:Uncharacterized protein n=1 Tax=Brassica oleracea var. oleracea TaxID=109376 RepID=A0A0D3D4J5_BRAOL